MEFKTNPWRVVNRDWKVYTANTDWIIIADNAEIADIFKAYGFTEIKKIVPKKSKDENTKEND